jgi:hypothetical protein
MEMYQASSYAIGPIDPTHLRALHVCLSNHQQICLLVPADLPPSVLNHPQFREGYEWGYLECDTAREWSVPQMVNAIYLALHRELQGEQRLSRYAWAVGFLLGDLASLAERERTLALVGIAHLCFLLACIPLDACSLYPDDCLMHMSAPHADALRAYRAEVRSYREQGKSFQEAQCLALVGCVS